MEQKHFLLENNKQKIYTNRATNLTESNCQNVSVVANCKEELYIIIIIIYLL